MPTKMSTPRRAARSRRIFHGIDLHGEVVGSLAGYGDSVIQPLLVVALPLPVEERGLRGILFLRALPLPLSIFGGHFSLEHLELLLSFLLLSLKLGACNKITQVFEARLAKNGYGDESHRRKAQHQNAGDLADCSNQHWGTLSRSGREGEFSENDRASPGLSAPIYHREQFDTLARDSEAELWRTVSCFRIFSAEAI